MSPNEQTARTGAPEFINPYDVTSFSDEDIERMLEGIRERRLHAVRVYEAALEEAQKLKDEKARSLLIKQSEMLAKNIERVSKALSALDDRVQKVRALKLQLGIE